MNWLLYAILAGMTLGVHVTLQKVASQYFSPLWAGLLYTAVVVGCYVPFACLGWHHGDRPVFSSAGIISVMALGITGALFVVFYQNAFRLSPSPAMVVTMTNAFSVTVSVMLVITLFHDAITPSKIAGIAMAIAGVTLALRG